MFITWTLDSSKVYSNIADSINRSIFFMCTELKVKIKNKEHKVKLEEKSSAWAEKEEAIGMYTLEDKMIHIYKNLGKKKKSIVLLHELIHSIIHLTKKNFLSDRQEESIAYALSESLVQYFKQNPELLDKFVEGVTSKSKKVKYKNIKVKK